jgi:monoamine oxidase
MRHADDLAAPTGRVLFAGEATSRTPATAFGAYDSGLREAARLLQLRASETAHQP